MVSGRSIAKNKSLSPRLTRKIQVGKLFLGEDQPIAVQSMCATHTSDVAATLAQIRLLENAGADIIRLAVDSRRDVEALKQIRPETDANLAVDLQESYKLAPHIAPYVQKLRYNPGHLHHHDRGLSVKDKVQLIADAAGSHGCAIRIGVNFGSIDPNLKNELSSPEEAAIQSALEHCQYLDDLGFKDFLVSLKSSDPLAVVAINRKFASLRPEVPLHLGVTEAGMLPEGEIKTRIAFEQLLSSGIGDTVRVSLTLPDEEKYREIIIAKGIIEDIANNRFRSVPPGFGQGLNVVSCPSCSRVENQAFVELARKVKAITEFARAHRLTIAVMGCRVNGPGETDDADIGLWCAPNHVNLKKGKELIGQFGYEEVLSKLVELVEVTIDQRAQKENNHP